MDNTRRGVAIRCVSLYHALEIWQMGGTRAFLMVVGIWCPGPAPGNGLWRALMNKWTKWNNTADKATTLAAGREFLAQQ